MSPEKFRTAVVDEFRFLIDMYNCHVTYPRARPSDPEWAVGYDVSFANLTTAVDISFQVPEQLPTVHLRRIDAVAGEMNIVSLGLLLLVCAPELNPLRSVSSLPLEIEAEELLQRYANALKITGHEILTGNFEVFPELRREGDRQLQIRASSPNRFTHF